jgi:hypothetical protein
MTIQVWTFLVSRNQSIDYKTVVAPDFIAEAKIRSLLTKVTDIEEHLSESGQISIREVERSEVGNLTIVFRSVKARSKDIGEQNSEVLTDTFGREIYWVEGLVFRKNVQEIRYKIGEIHLDQAHEYLQDKYREFWYEDKLGVSRVNNLDKVTSESNNKFKLLEPLVITPRPQSPKHELSVNENYSSIKFSRNNTSWLKPVLITIASLFSILILIGIGVGLQKNPICLYSTEDVPIKQKLEIKYLQNLKINHPQAWILLNGQLKLNVKDYDSLADSILSNTKRFTIEPDNNTKRFTIEPDNNTKIFTIKNHPIESAINILKNIKDIDTINLKATIIEPISLEKSECKISGR